MEDGAYTAAGRLVLLACEMCEDFKFLHIDVFVVLAKYVGRMLLVTLRFVIRYWVVELNQSTTY